MREFDKALEYYKKVLELFEETGMKIEKARTLMNLGDVFIKKGDNKRALEYYCEAKGFARGSFILESINRRLKSLERL